MTRNSKKAEPTSLTIFEKVDRKARRKRQIRITAESVTLGSSEHCDVQLTQLSESILIEVKQTKNSWWLINPHRSRKIKVNAKSVDLEQKLQDGDQILIDEHLICFEDPIEKSSKNSAEYHFLPSPGTDQKLWDYFLEEDDFDEILINGPKQIFVDFKGILIKTPWEFSSEKFLSNTIDQFSLKAKKKEGYSSWNMNGNIRIAALSSPIVTEPHLCLRKIKKHVFKLEDLEEQGFGTPEEIGFLKEAVNSRQNILISGGTSTGKTVLLRSLVETCSEKERLVILEEEKEVEWSHPHCVCLETGPSNLQMAVKESLRLRPDRLIISELRSAEAFEFLQAINTGHPGSMTSIHANSPREALYRLENLLLLNGFSMNEDSLKRQVSSALNILVHLERSVEGKRKISSIQRITGSQNNVYLLCDPIGQENSGIHLHPIARKNHSKKNQAS